MLQVKFILGFEAKQSLLIFVRHFRNLVLDGINASIFLDNGEQLNYVYSINDQEVFQPRK